ncbi:MAG TPA: glycosyltransferase, partial [Solirubrobacteraceae bacterium]|nr:glycosyltransferase [Solirubrobacteraceae bacterium]
SGPVELAAAHPGGGRYGGLWLLLRSAGAPRALVKRAFEPGPVTRIDARALLAELGLGDATAPPPDPEPAPAISVVIASTLARDAALRACLQAIVALDYPRFEVLLVDNSRPRREPPPWLEELPAVRLLREPAPGASAARNRGLAEASGELVAFTDDDTEVDPRWLRAIAARLAAHPDEVGLTGLALTGDLETAAQLAFERYYRAAGGESLEPLSHRLAAGRRALGAATVTASDDFGRVVRRFSLYESGRLGSGNTMAFRSAALRAAGGFDVALGPGTAAPAGEDIELFARLLWRGHALGFEPRALVRHRHRLDERQLRRQIEGYGIGFTASATALSIGDPRHLGSIAATVPRGLALLGGNFARKLRAGAAGAPAEIPGLARAELRGMLEGPLAYLRSRRRARRRPRETPGGRLDG